MSNLAATLKQEISRLARKELRRELDGLKVDRARTVGDLLALVADLLED